MGFAILKHPDLFIDSFVENWVLYKTVQVTILILNKKDFGLSFIPRELKS